MVYKKLNPGLLFGRSGWSLGKCADILGRKPKGGWPYKPFVECASSLSEETLEAAAGANFNNCLYVKDICVDECDQLRRNSIVMGLADPFASLEPK